MGAAVYLLTCWRRCCRAVIARSQFTGQWVNTFTHVSEEDRWDRLCVAPTARHAGLSKTTHWHDSGCVTAATGHICCVDKTMHETLSCPFALCNTPCMLRVPCIALTLFPPPSGTPGRRRVAPPAATMTLAGSYPAAPGPSPAACCCSKALACPWLPHCTHSCSSRRDRPAAATAAAAAVLYLLTGWILRLSGTDMLRERKR
jgi:hypothetical protein